MRQLTDSDLGIVTIDHEFLKKTDEVSVQVKRAYDNAIDFTKGKIRFYVRAADRT